MEPVDERPRTTDLPAGRGVSPVPSLLPTAVASFLASLAMMATGPVTILGWLLVVDDNALMGQRDPGVLAGFSLLGSSRSSPPGV